MTKTKKRYTLIHSSSVWDSTPSYEMWSEHPANSKKWCAEVREIERETGVSYHWYWAHRHYADRRPICSYRFDWTKA